jgi:kynureninase
MIALADEYGLAIGSPRQDAARGGTVVLEVPGAERVCHELLATNALLDFRPGVGLRLAPHFFTKDDEVDEVMRRVRDETRRTGG